ncbi:hypothetical protein [Runella zeae]|uniref:hypothetical protein n=1 Tax=Runella zeae TaxID=94255 RepID=UPI00040F078E|nr:hypothetical protein [Runella zeae]
MNTTVFKPATKSESPFDEANSLLAITIYHQNPVNHQGKKNLKYYLKKKIDREYDALLNEDERLMLELNRSVRFIENKLKSRYGDNQMTSIQIYFNDNKGGTIPESHPNAMLCKLNIFTNGQCEPHINRDIIATQEGVDFVTKIMESWQYYIQQTRR